MLVGGGFFVSLDWFDKKKKERAKEADALDEKIISRLKEDIRLQGESIDALKREVGLVRDENIKLAAENKTLTRILQGKDENSEALQLEAFKAIKQIDTIHDIMTKQVETNNSLANSVKDLVDKLPNVIPAI